MLLIHDVIYQKELHGGHDNGIFNYRYKRSEKFQDNVTSKRRDYLENADISKTKQFRNVSHVNMKGVHLFLWTLFF